MTARMTALESPPAQTRSVADESGIPATPDTTVASRRPPSRWQLVTVGLLLGALGWLALSDLAEINADYERLVLTLQRPLF